MPIKPLRQLRVATAIVALLPTVADAQVAFFDPQEGLNMVSLGVGSAPDYMGSGNNKTAVAPLARYYFAGRRYAQILGPQISINVLNDDVWQFGPQLLVRLKRDSSVEDPVVAQMRPIDAAAEAGVFIAATWPLSADPRHRFGVRADIQGGENGAEGSLTASFFLPVSRAIVFNVSGGLGYTNDKWARTYFGVQGSDIALYPGLNGRAYTPSGGVFDGRINVGAIVHLSPSWHAGLGLRYQQLQGDYADSPIVAARGNRSQRIYGIALGYIWQ
ncbi:MAG: MipA/OmpV family protein [Chitinophagaceae bacterium]|nr:MipA/OmpV family protein [Rubrivivax sp.]